MEINNILVCTNCGKEMPFTPENSRCPVCGEPLEVKNITQGSVSSVPYGASFMERYHNFYPYMDPVHMVTLGEGNTGVVDCSHLAQDLGFDSGTLFIKNETQNPTWSFKDRGTVVAANFARNHGYTSLGVCSSGNNAASCAAYAAALGMKAYIFVPDHILEEKILPVAVYGATVIKVDGDYGKLYDVSASLSKEYKIFFANSDVPLRVEGAKSVAFEICEQFDFDPPEWVIVPNSSGGNLRGIEKGFYEFKQAGLIRHEPKIVAAQAEGSCPLYRAWEKGDDHITHFGPIFTVAHGVANPYPPSGNQVLRLIKEGRINRPEMVLEKDILPAQRVMAKSGIFGQPASALSMAAAKQLLDKGIIKKGERVVAIVTGSGLKAASLLSETAGYSIYSEKLEHLSSLLKTIG